MQTHINTRTYTHTPRALAYAWIEYASWTYLTSYHIRLSYVHAHWYAHFWQPLSVWLSAYQCLCVCHTPINAHTHAHTHVHTYTQLGTRTQIKYNKVLACCSVFFLSFRFPFSFFSLLLLSVCFFAFSADNDEYSVIVVVVVAVVACVASTLYRQLYRQQLFRHPKHPLNWSVRFAFFLLLSYFLSAISGSITVRVSVCARVVIKIFNEPLKRQWDKAALIWFARARQT